jgi:hypothetical protein
MFRLLAILGVVAAFGATLYYGGDRLEAWESPQAAVEAAEASGPRSKKTAKGSGKARKAKSAPSVPRWVLRLEALCRRGQAQTDALRPPAGPADTIRYVNDYARLNERWNRRAVALLSGSAGKRDRYVKQLLPLMSQEEAAVKSMLAAAKNGQVGRLRGISNRLLRIAKAENRLLIKMDAIACTVSPDVFRL